MFERLAGKILQRFLSKYFTTGTTEQNDDGGEDEETAAAAAASSSEQAAEDYKKQKSRRSSSSNNNNNAPSNNWTSMMGVWSGYVSLEDLQLKTDVLNEKLRASGQPFEVVHGSIGRLELTVPWSKLTATSSAPAANNNSNSNSSKQQLDPSAAIVVVLDGVHLLVRTRYEFDDDALRRAQVSKRQKALQEASVFKSSNSTAASENNASTTTTTKSWLKQVLQQRLQQQGILPQIANNLQIHIRDLHIRVEDIASDPVHPFSCGIVLESMHVQHADEQQSLQRPVPPIQVLPVVQSPRSPSNKSPGSKRGGSNNRSNNSNKATISKVSQLNHFAIYWNALDAEPGVATENSILQYLKPREITWALDRGIARRANSLQARLPRAAPKHAYLLVPVDATLQVEISTDPTRLEDQPAISMVFLIPDLTFQVRDFQCVQVLLLSHMVQEHKYSKQYRRFRPTVSVYENPRAWWRYALEVIQYEIKENRVRWSWRRFHQRYAARQRYCDLYERKLRTPSPDMAAGPELAQTRSGLTDAEAFELQEMDDGLTGDLSIHDIILYRVVVNRRIGVKATVASAGGGRKSSWFGRSVQSFVHDDAEAEEEYERLLAYWRQSSEEATDGGSDDEDDVNNRSLVAVSIQLHVEAGHIAYFSPLSSTADQKQVRRLQQQFLDFTFTSFDVTTSLMGDFESLLVRVTLEDFIAEEMRSDRSKHTVMTRTASKLQANPFVVGSETPPLLALLFTKNPPTANDFRIGIQAQVHAIEVHLVPDCEWLGRMKLLLRPIPQLQKAAKFWEDISMAYINSWAAGRLEQVLAKAKTALSEHKNMDMDVHVDCPLIRIADGEGSDLVLDLGQARLKTIKLAGVADAKLVHSVKTEYSNASDLKKHSLVRSVDPSSDDISRGDASGLLPRSTYAMETTANAPTRTITWDTTPSPKKRTRAFNDDASRDSGLMPRSLATMDTVGTKGPGRSVSWDKKSHRSVATGSVFGGSIGVDDSMRLEGDAFSIVSKYPLSGNENMEAFFYDVYELQVQTGSLSIESAGSDTRTLSDGVGIRVTLHKSIIPADHTLCRLKAYCTVGEVMLSVSESKILHLARFSKRWVSVLAGAAPLYVPPENFRTPSRRLQVAPIPESATMESSDSASVIDEDEFFDAVDHTSYVSGDGTDLLDDHWVEDTDSVIESETRSLSQNFPRRRRNSISDVSTISGGSATKRRAQYQETNTYLSADNLARLEEEAEESSAEDDHEEDDASFHSAMTPSHLVDLERDLADNIEQAETNIRDLGQRIRGLQHSSDVTSDTKEALHQRKMLRLELHRSTAELDAMNATRFDLLAQIDRTEDMNEKEDSPVQSALHAQSSLSARNAFVLLQNARKRAANAANPVDIEHSMTQGLKRELVQFTLVFDEIAVQLEGIEDSIGAGGSTGVSDAIVLCITQSVGVFRKSVGDSKCHMSVDHVSVSVRRKSPLETRQYLIVVGGATDSLPGGALQSRFPQYISSATMDDRFMRGVFESRRGVGRQSQNVSKLRLVLGDVEVRPQVSSIKTVREVLTRIRNGLSEGQSSRQKAIKNAARDASKVPGFFDVKMRAGSLRVLLDIGGGVDAALALTDVGFRFVGIAKLCDYKDRSQFEARVGNIQALSIDDFDAGRGIEMFGKRDPYSPLIRLRLKNQIVIEEETGGWVVGQLAANDRGVTGNQVPAKDMCVLNSYANVKLESIGVLLSPKAVAGLLHSVCSLRDAIKDTTKRSSGNEADVSNGQVALVGEDLKADFEFPVRWRADISLKKSSIYLQKPASTESLSTKQQRLLISSSMIASLQPVPQEREGAILQATFRGLSVSRVSDEWPLVESTVVAVRLVAPLRNRHCIVLVHPHLVLPDPTWNEAEATLEWSEQDDGQSSPGGGVPFSLLVSVSPLRVNIAVSVAALLIEIGPPLILALKPRKTSGPDDERPRHSSRVNPPRPPRRPFVISLRVSAEYVRTVVLREGGNATGIAMSETLASITLGELTGSFRKTSDSIKFSVAATQAAVVDYACRPGIQALRSNGLERVLGSRAGASDDLLESPKFLVVTGDIAQFSDRILANLDVQLGCVQCLLLPSLIKSLLTFQRNLSECLPKKQRSTSQKEGSSIQATVRKIHRIDLSIGMESFECILPSKDLPKYVRESSEEPIGVATFRLRFNVLGTLEVMLLDEETGDSMLTLPGEDRQLLKAALATFLKRRVGSPGSSTAISSNLELCISEFQVLRTAIKKSVIVPHGFNISPPAAGEQRITNSFSFGITHQLSGAWLPPTNGQDIESSFNLSQGFHVKADWIDVLVYITQSSGGFSDAMRVTVKPILETLKKADNPSSVQIKEPAPTNASFAAVVSRASTVFSVKADGVKFTCVPGGATRLTESPIIKFVVLQLSSGGAAVPVPGDVKLISGTNLDSTTKVSGIAVQHLVVGGWLNCEVSASYHNRRLVAWEPFIEPWTLEARLGVDLVRALKMRPLFEGDASHWNSLEEPLQPVLNPSLGSGATRLRGISRLLRSPFRSGKSSSKTSGELALSRILEADGDFCYLMLASSSNETIADALFEPSSDADQAPLSVLPGANPAQWLSRFGYPFPKSSDLKDSEIPPAVICWVSDAAPLNVNLTGALIENLSQYRVTDKGRTFGRIAPHWIRNDTGLTLRFQEVLDNDRMNNGEKSPRVTLSNGTEAPLSLKRSLSQSCDPHNAYIMVECGNFEDTVGRIDQKRLDVQKGFRSSTFYYRTAAKIPVDMVGVHRYPLDLNIDKRSDTRNGPGSDTRSLGWVIVRVELRGGVKMVSIESPVVVKNVSDCDILCEVRDHDGLSSLWRCLIPRVTLADGFIPVPADLAAFVHEAAYSFSVIALPKESNAQHESELEGVEEGFATRLSPPPPYSEASFARGVVDETSVSVPVLETTTGSREQSLFLNACALRVGAFSLDQSSNIQQGSKSEPAVPEQRMLLFRSPLVVRNYLALPIRVQARLQRHQKSLGSSATEEDVSIDDGDWTDLGTLECGRQLSWTGAVPSEKIDMRVRFTGSDGGTLRQFPHWSTPVTIESSDHSSFRHVSRSSSTGAFVKLPKMRIDDSSRKPLLVSLAMSRGDQPTGGTGSFDSVRDLSQHMPAGSRVISLYAPFWIVDGTGLDLQYQSGAFVAGQVDAGLPPTGEKDSNWNATGATLGLGELLDDSDLVYLPSRLSFQTLMIGEETSTKLHVRRRLTRVQLSRDTLSSWSEPIPLNMREKSYHDTAVLPPSKLFTTAGKEKRGESDVTEAFALRSRVLKASESMGGSFGTKLVHVVCRYAVVNELGRDIEIVGDRGQRAPIVIYADGRPRPFHFDDSGPIRFRPKEFGWRWSGRVQVSSDHREITMLLRHELKDHSILVTVELQGKQVSGTCILVFRKAAHAPYRIENHSMFPLQFRQKASLLTSRLSRRSDIPQDTIILPYHHADFAWDEPDLGQRSVSLQVADFGNLPSNIGSKALGSFKLDRLSPGSDVRLGSPLLRGEVIADGPTRVLRVSEASAHGAASVDHGKFHAHTAPSSEVTTMISVKFTHGVGISVVDWKPQELIYIRMDNILLEQSRDSDKESGRASIGSIIVDNQLWVTPYPVLLRMGSRSKRRRNRRNGAISLLWSRSLSTRSGFDDLSLLQLVELSTEPSTISVDGNIGKLALEMARRIKDLGSRRSGTVVLASRNEELRRVLGITEGATATQGTESAASQRSLLVDDLYSAIDYMATAAIASKLRSRYRPPNQGASGNGAADQARSKSLSKSRRKYYIEKLKISTTAAQVSWSGALPLASSLPLLMRPALTFEGLPLFLRSFSSSHTYGTTEEHVRSLKSHYISIWRIMDLLVGVLTKPTFLLRACVFTSREIGASALSSLSSGLLSSENSLRTLIPKEETEQNTSVSLVFKAIVRPVVKFNASILHTFSHFAASGSAMLRYDAAMHHAAGLLVRSRNPRLFANVDGKDLLVEYVEGENAGKALLSRVRMGAHLGEGYMYHVEGTHLKKDNSKQTPGESDSTVLILMITFERVLLLNGKLNANFCDVVWEASFEDLIHVETSDISKDENYGLVLLWFLANSSSPSTRNRDERHANAILDDTSGLDTLHCKYIYVPKAIMTVLVAKIAMTNPGLVEQAMPQ